MSDTVPAKKPPELALRVVTGVALIAVALVALALGGVVFWLLATLAWLLMMTEWADLNGVSIRHKRLALYSLFVPLALMSPLGAGPGFLSLGLLAGAAFFIVIITNRRELALGTIYCGLPVLALLLIRRQHLAGPDLSTYPGLIYTLWALALVWATDIGAYFAGRAIGGPKLAPVWSPNKTWAGLIGGMISATLVGMALMTVLHWQARLVAFSALLAVAAQAGDLFESMMKRRAGVKDSGWLLPGHGGVMDRLDGAVPVLCIVALIVASGIL